MRKLPLLGAGVLAALTLSACTTTSDSGSGTADASKSDAAAITITDVKDRTVTFDSPPERIILGEGRALISPPLRHLLKKN